MCLRHLFQFSCTHTYQSPWQPYLKQRGQVCPSLYILHNVAHDCGQILCKSLLPGSTIEFESNNQTQPNHCRGFLTNRPGFTWRIKVHRRNLESQSVDTIPSSDSQEYYVIWRAHTEPCTVALYRSIGGNPWAQFKQSYTEFPELPLASTPGPANSKNCVGTITDTTHT